MKHNVGRIWMSLCGLALAVVVIVLRDSLAPVEATGEDLFLRALGQLGILYIIALFVERSLEVLIKAWRQGGKSRIKEKVRTAAESDRAAVESELQEYRAGTQKRALLLGLTLGIMVSLAGVRLLGVLFDSGGATAPFQQAVFHFTDVVLTAGLIGGGSATIHELMALIDDFLKASRRSAKGS
ncbi:MAG: hypothetical protein OXL34_16670 [Gemmatimonadota bacterium]|nr:hypothetical protein [Gemmatimonadota bacterium]